MASVARNAAPSREYHERGYFRPDSILSRVLEEAPYIARCSDNKTATRMKPRHYAVRYPYMQINRANMVSWLIFDLDHTNPWCWEDARLPMPNLIVRNPVSNKSHLFYAITPVCTSERARSGPIAYMKAIYEAFAAKLKADPRYHSGPVAKTPGHPWWRTTELHANVYELSELAKHVELVKTAPWSKGAQLDKVQHSRHCILFEYVRHYAYAIVGREREGGNFEAFSRMLEAYAEGQNNFRHMTHLKCSTDLPLSSLRATVRSIARWTWNRYTGSGRSNVGVMRLDPDLPLPERQALAAQRTHDKRTQATEGKLRRICATLVASGKAVTQAAVAAVAGLARQTVAKYKHVLEAAKEPAAPPAPGRAAESPGEVKFAAYQIPAATGGPGVVVPLRPTPAVSAPAVDNGRPAHSPVSANGTALVIPLAPRGRRPPGVSSASPHPSTTTPERNEHDAHE